jgi:hypothetical protein
VLLVCATGVPVASAATSGATAAAAQAGKGTKNGNIPPVIQRLGNFVARCGGRIAGALGNGNAGGEGGEIGAVIRRIGNGLRGRGGGNSKPPQRP